MKYYLFIFRQILSKKSKAYKNEDMINMYSRFCEMIFVESITDFFSVLKVKSNIFWGGSVINWNWLEPKAEPP